MTTMKTQVNPAMTSAFHRITRPVIASAVFFMLVTGLLYPLLTTGAAQLLFHDQAQGSLITRDGQTVGATLIGQCFRQPQYFHGRPSATFGTDPNEPSQSVELPYNAASSGASNQGVLSKSLLQAVAQRVKLYREENELAADAKVPVDAVTASASGLDPHISVANARLQVPRVAKQRHATEQEVLALLEKNTVQRQFGVLGEPRIHVLELNLALDKALRDQPVTE